MKNILILGGTKFMGRLLTEQLLEDNRYTVTLFNRGKSAPSLFPNLNLIQGDRETDDYLKISKQDWDVIIDFSCYQPNSLERLINSLKGKVKRYIFISTVSVFDLDNSEMPILDDAPQLPYTQEMLDNPAISKTNYGPKKVRCEEILKEADWLDSIVFRPSFVYGQYDFTERFYYWLYRVKTQPLFMVPDDGKEVLNLTFVDDLVAFVLEAIEIERHRFDYNLSTHPANSLLEKLAIMTDVLETTPNYLFIPLEDIRESLTVLKTSFPCILGLSTRDISNSKLLEDFKTVPLSFRASIVQMAHYHDRLGWKEGIAGLRVSDEKVMLE